MAGEMCAYRGIEVDDVLEIAGQTDLSVQEACSWT